jgi:hypothetical protein
LEVVAIIKMAVLMVGLAAVAVVNSSSCSKNNRTLADATAKCPIAVSTYTQTIRG